MIEIAGQGKAINRQREQPLRIFNQSRRETLDKVYPDWKNRSECLVSSPVRTVEG